MLRPSSPNPLVPSLILGRDNLEKVKPALLVILKLKNTRRCLMCCQWCWLTATHNGAGATFYIRNLWKKKKEEEAKTTQWCFCWNGVCCKKGNTSCGQLKFTSRGICISIITSVQETFWMPLVLKCYYFYPFEYFPSQATSEQQKASWLVTCQCLMEPKSMAANNFWSSLAGVNK